MAVNIHITIIELNALHTKRQNLFQELDAVIHLLMEAKHWGLRKSRNATSLNSRDRKSGSAGMPRPISYAVFCLKKKIRATCEARACLTRKAVRPRVLVLDRLATNNDRNCAAASGLH